MNNQPIALLTSTGFLLDKQLRKLTYKLTGNRISIGRSSENDICINNRKLSKQHARLSYTNNQWEIEDLESVNSVYVNQEKIFTLQRLKYGDLISFGGIEFIFELKKQSLVLRQDTLSNITKDDDFKLTETICLNNVDQLNLKITPKYYLYFRILHWFRKFKLLSWFTNHKM